MSKVSFLIALSVLSALPPSHAFAQCSFLFADGFEDGPFEVQDAAAISAGQVEVCFNHQVLASTLSGGGEQFVFSGSLTSSAAVASGRNVLVTTSTQLAGFGYSVSVAHSLTDVAGNPVSATADTAGFTGFSP
jgi:hypothetical protein